MVELSIQGRLRPLSIYGNIIAVLGSVCKSYHKGRFIWGLHTKSDSVLVPAPAEDVE